MYCGNCGQQLPAGAKVCPNCGKACESYNVAEPVQDPSAAPGSQDLGSFAAPVQDPAAAPVYPSAGQTAGQGKKPGGKRWILPTALTIAVVLVLGIVGGVLWLRKDKPTSDDLEEVASRQESEEDQEAEERSSRDEADEDKESQQPEETQQTEEDKQAEEAQEESEYPVSLTVYSADQVITDMDGNLNRVPLTDVVVSLRQGQQQDGEVFAVAEVSEDGTVKAYVPAGTYTAQVEAPGYAVSYMTLEVSQETQADGYVLPLPEEGQTAAVLTWEGDADLDLVLVTPYETPDGEAALVEASASSDSNGNRLISDNVSGCEVVYINTGDGGGYQLYVDNATDSEEGNYDTDTLSRSKPHIDIYGSQGLVMQLECPRDQVGVAWEAASLEGGQVTSRGTLHGSQGETGWWMDSKWELDLRDCELLENLLEATTKTLCYNTHLRGGTQEAAGSWVNDFYNGDCSEVVDLFFAECNLGLGDFEDPDPAKGQELQQRLYEEHQDNPEYWVGWMLTADQLEYIAYAITGRQREIQSVENLQIDILDNDGCVGVIEDRLYDCGSVVMDGDGPLYSVELLDDQVKYIGGGRWSVRFGGYVYLVEAGDFKLAEITYILQRNPDSYFNGYSITDIAVDMVDHGWALAYEDLIKQQEEEVANWNSENGEMFHWGYSLVYLDGDAVPELVTGPDDCWVSVYTWRNGQLKQLIDEWSYGIWGNVGYYYYPGTGTISYTENSVGEDGETHYETIMRLNASGEWETVWKTKTEGKADQDYGGYVETLYLWDASLGDYHQATQEEVDAAYGALGLDGVDSDYLSGMLDIFDFRMMALQYFIP